MFDHDSDEGVDRTLGKINTGGKHLVVIARQRIGEALDSLDDGNFTLALHNLGAAQGVLSPLASAQIYIAVADDAQVIKCADLETGMYISDVGEVTDLDHHDGCGLASCPGHVTVHVGDHEMTFRADREVYVIANPDPDE